MPRGLAIVLGLFWATFAAALYTEWNPGPLSKEAQEYVSIAEMVNYSGVDLRFALQKLCFLVGVVALLAGSALALTRRRLGAVSLTVAAIPMAMTVLLGESASYYPLIQGLAARTLWCATSAVWGAAVSLAWIEVARRPHDDAT
jgi:hypothetical protein